MTGPETRETKTGFEIPAAELEVRASRSGGPGGQHVNTSSTRVEVRWNILGTRALTDPERARVRARLASRIDGGGWIRVVASDSRSQARNREAAVERLHALVEKALKVEKPRRPTRVPRAEKERRLAVKRRRAERKRERRMTSDD